MEVEANKLNSTIEYYKKYRLPLSRGNKSVRQYLAEIYNNYKNYANTSEFLELQDKKAIEQLCDGIIEVLAKYDAFDMIGSYSTFFKVMDEIKDHLWYSFVEDTSQGYYRVRRGIADKRYNSLEMLHIPFSSRQLADNSRFSLPGIPSTYMSTIESVAWYESGLCEKFYIASYGVNTKSYKKYKLLYLDINPLYISHIMQVKILNSNDDISEIIKIYVSLAKIFPLLLACSIAVNNKQTSFKEEYIIPQILMSWVKRSSDFIGIRYNTASKYEDAAKYVAHNIVIPIRGVDDDGYCKILKSIFLENAKVEYIDVQQILDKYKDLIEEIRELYATIKYSMQISKVELPYSEILDICQSIILNYDLLCTSYSQCAYACLKNLSYLYGYANIMVCSFSEKYGADFSRFTVKDIYQHLLTDKIKSDVQHTLQEFNYLLVKRFLFDFINFDSTIFN